MPAPGRCSQFHPLVYFAQKVHSGEMEHRKPSSHGRQGLRFRAASLKLKQLLATQGAWQLLPGSPKVWSLQSPRGAEGFIAWVLGALLWCPTAQQQGTTTSSISKSRI